MAGFVRVELLEGTNTRSNTRTTILMREDRPHLAVAFYACDVGAVRSMIERAERDRDLIPWHFAETPAGVFTELTKLGEYTLNIKDDNTVH